MQGDREKSSQSQEKTAIKTIARVPTTKGTKRRVDTKSEEAYTVMKQLSSNIKKRDDFDVYGEYVAGILRNLKSKSVLAFAKYEINSALYRAEMADIPTNTPEPSTTPASEPPASTPFSASTTDTEDQSYNRPGSSTAMNTSDTSPIQTQSYGGAEDISQDELTFSQMLLNMT